MMAHLRASAATSSVPAEACEPTIAASSESSAGCNAGGGGRRGIEEERSREEHSREHGRRDATPPRRPLRRAARLLDAAAFEILRYSRDDGRAPGDGAAGHAPAAAALRRAVWQLLGAGFVGTCAVGAFWYSRTPARRKVARGVALTVDEPVVEPRRRRR